MNNLVTDYDDCLGFMEKSMSLDEQASQVTVFFINNLIKNIPNGYLKGVVILDCSDAHHQTNQTANW